MSKDRVEKVEFITQEYTFEFHYYLEKKHENFHRINAKIKYESDREIYELLTYIAKTQGIQITIEESALETGGVIKQIVITLITIGMPALGGYIAKAAVDTVQQYISSRIVSPKEQAEIQNLDSQTKLNNIELHKKAEELYAQGKSPEEITMILNGEFLEALEGDKKAALHRSNYYSQLKKEKNLTAVEYMTTDSYGNKTEPRIVKKNEFNQFIISEKTESETSTKYFLFEIYMPCLDDSRKDEWRGIINGKPFKFIMSDAGFASKVSKKEIAIPHGFSVVAEIEVKTNRSSKKYYLKHVHDHSEDRDLLLSKYDNILTSFGDEVSYEDTDEGFKLFE